MNYTWCLNSFILMKMKVFRNDILIWNTANNQCFNSWFGNVWKFFLFRWLSLYVSTSVANLSFLSVIHVTLSHSFLCMSIYGKLTEFLFLFFVFKYNNTFFFFFIVMSPIVFQSSPGAGKIVSQWSVWTCIWSDSGTFRYRSSFIVVCHATAGIQTEGTVRFTGKSVFWRFFFSLIRKERDTSLVYLSFMTSQHA